MGEVVSNVLSIDHRGLVFLKLDQTRSFPAEEFVEAGQQSRRDLGHLDNLCKVAQGTRPATLGIPPFHKDHLPLLKRVQRVMQTINLAFSISKREDDRPEAIILHPWYGLPQIEKHLPHEAHLHPHLIQRNDQGLHL